MKNGFVHEFLHCKLTSLAHLMAKSRSGPSNREHVLPRIQRQTKRCGVSDGFQRSIEQSALQLQDLITALHSIEKLPEVDPDHSWEYISMPEYLILSLEACPQVSR
jgi:hypothetical protein